VKDTNRRAFIQTSAAAGLAAVMPALLPAVADDKKENETKNNSKLNPKTTVLLTLDCQKGIVGFVPGCERIFKAAARVIDAARSKKIPVIHVGIGFRPGYPEVSHDHPAFSRVLQTNNFIIGTESAAFHESIAPKADEIIVYKHRVSAFSGNDLEMILRCQGITHLVLFGIATSGIVLSTVRQASDLDFRCIVVQDCCFDADEEVHRVLAEKVLAKQATVVTSDVLVGRMI
jgi:nicotinamidase-related amidase